MPGERLESSRRREAGRIALFALILAMMAPALLLSLPAAQASAAARGTSGTISGRLLDGTRNNAPVAGQSVTLQMAQDGTARDLTTLKSHADGSFLFEDLNPASGIQYAIYTRYQGAQYFTNPIDLSKHPQQRVDLTVYDATQSSANLAVVQATILIQEPDASKGSFTVSEIYFFQNIGKTTYVGSLNGNQGRPNALLFSLPQGARNVALDQGFNSVEAIQVNGGFATDAAVPPGETEFSFSFEVPYQSTSFDFGYTFNYPTVQLSMLTPPVLHASSGALISKGLMTANGHPYLLLQNQNFRGGDQVHVELEGLPQPSSRSTGVGLQGNWLWLVIGILGMLLIIVASSVLHQVLQRRRKPRGKTETGAHTRTRTHTQHTQVREHAAARPRTAPRRATSPASRHKEQDELLQQLLELDKAFEAGRLKQAEYRKQRAGLKARLRELMSAEEVPTDHQGEPETTASDAPASQASADGRGKAALADSRKRASREPAERRRAAADLDT